MVYIENESHDPLYNQAFEEYVFDACAPGESVLMLWRNEPAVVCGCYQNVYAEVDMLRARDMGVHIVRRISGGGTVYHDLGNVNYTIMAPAGEAADYTRFIEPVAAALRRLGIPAVMNRTCDIAVNGLKVSGSAQKTAKGRVLHHGTLLYDTDLGRLHALADGQRGKYTSKGIQSVPWPVANMKTSLHGAIDTAEFAARLQEELAGDARILKLTDAERENVQHLAGEKYASWEWTFGRSPAFSCETAFERGGERVQLFYRARRGVIESVAFDHAGAVFDEAARRLTGAKLDEEPLRAALDGLPGFEKLYRVIL